MAVEVAAALIFEEGRFLICQRPPHKARGLKWEFAGGKVEPGETGEQALIRECREELGVQLRVLREFMTLTHRYPDITVQLTVYLAEIIDGTPRQFEHVALKWIYPHEAEYYDFCPADAPVLKKIREEFLEDPQKQRLGRRGERRAARYLKRRGYKISERNFRTPFGEIDLIAKKGDVTVFCEVKTRTGDSYGSPREAVNADRRRRYVQAAKYYIKSGERTVRFDVIEITPDGVNHIENAFTEQT